MLRASLALVGIGLVGSPLLAETPPDVAARVQALSHPRYAEREKAARDLEVIGEPALKSLREAAQSTDEELRARAQLLADRIERNARSQRLLEAPKLALRFDKTPLEKAVAEFAAKAQRRVILDRAAVKNADRTVTLDTGRVPYWEAVDAFYKAAGLVEDDEPFTPPPPGTGVRSGPGPASGLGVRPGQSTMIRLMDGEPAGSVAAGQAFRVHALRANFGQNRFDDVKGTVTLHLDVEAAPGVAVREVVGIEVRKAIADDGRELPAAYPEPPGVIGSELDGQMAIRQMIAVNDLMLSGGMGAFGQPQAVTVKTEGLRPRKLAELQGVVVARVVTPPEPVVTLRRLLDGSGREATVDGTTVRVLDLSV